MPALTHGPLPARVYWVRRLLVLITAALLVFAFARLLGGGSDASSSGDGERGGAQLAGGTVSSAATGEADPSTSAAKPTATTTGRTRPGRPSSSTATPTLAAPVGTCAGSDIAVTPKVENAVGGRDVVLVLQLRTVVAEACTWRVSPDALAVAVTSGDDAIWNSRSCPRAIPRQDVVVRKAATTNVDIVWKQAKRSDKDCSPRTAWASPGWYHVSAAALGGEPSDVQFELVAPTAATVTVTATPKQDPTKKPSSKPSKKPGTSPSGAAD